MGEFEADDALAAAAAAGDSRVEEIIICTPKILPNALAASASSS